MPSGTGPPELRTGADRRSDQDRTWLEETATPLDRILHDSGSITRVYCKETANVC